MPRLRKIATALLALAGLIVLAACASTDSSCPKVEACKAQCPQTASSFTLTRDGQAAAAIVIGKQASTAERHAAEELARYVKAISGADLPIVTGRPKRTQTDNLILIGQPTTLPMIEKLNACGAITVTPETPGFDGFVIKTVRCRGKNLLVLASAMDRGCLFAVYHLLENEAKIGFFNYGGETIPSNPNLSVGSIDLSERPQFPDREYFQNCAFSYSSQFWDLPAWQAEIDWMAKKKYNMLHMNLAWQRAMKNTLESLGVERPPLTPWDLYEEQLLKDVFAYARERGIRIVGPAFNGYVPVDFRKKYPDIHYVTVDWLGGVDVNQLIFPDDPMFVKIGTKFIQEYIKIMGTDHLYNVDPFPECDPGDTPEEKTRVKSSYAKSVVQYIGAADPEGVWVCSGWAFTYRHFWPKADAKAFLDACPFDKFIVNDIFVDREPIYKELDYFFGKQWGLGVLHSMGGWTTVHGNLADTIARVHEVVNDPKSINCVNYYFNPETVHHNAVVFDLAGELAWNPKAVELDSFLDDYLVRRYGAEAGPKMRPVWDELLASVYGNFDFTAPRYQVLPSVSIPDELPAREAYIPHLKKALELALAQKDVLGDNHAYQIDLIDITRQWVAEVFNVYWRQMIAAYRASDKAAFDAAAAGMLKCLDYQEINLSSDRDYSILPEIERGLKMPKHTREAWGHDLTDNGQMVRQRYSALFGTDKYPMLVDYCMRDMYELVKFYYRPRMEMVLSALREHIDSPGEFDDLFNQLSDEYKAIITKFIQTPIEDYGAPPSPYAGKPVQAAEAVYQMLSEQ